MTQERVQALAEYWRTEDKDRDSVLAFGKTWGLSALKVREARADKRVMAEVRAWVDVESLYGAARAIKVLSAIMDDPKHRERLKAVRTQLEMAGMLKTGPAIQNTNMIVNPYEYETMSDAEIAAQVEKVAEERGWIKRPEQD